MNDRSFDALTSRASLASLSAAGLGTPIAPFAARGKKKKNGNDDKAK